MTPPTVLIADDDVDLLDTLALRCRGLGVEVATADNSLLAMQLIVELDPDLVCLDVNMPGVSGLEVCSSLSCDQRFAQMPVIILTCRTDPSVIRRCHEMCAYYVLKDTEVWLRLEPLIRELLADRLLQAAR